MDARNSHIPPEPAGPVSGLFRSVSNLVATFATMVKTRLELLTTELQEEVQRAAVLIAWAAIALVATFIGLLLGALTVIFAFWDTHRVLAALLVTGTFLVLAAVSIIVVVARVRSQPRFLEGTISELAKDGEQLRSHI